jgi:hypothetical protein
MVGIRLPPPVSPSPQRIRAGGRKVVSEVVAGADLTTDDRPDAVRTFPRPVIRGQRGNYTVQSHMTETPNGRLHPFADLARCNPWCLSPRATSRERPPEVARFEFSVSLPGLATRRSPASKISAPAAAVHLDLFCSASHSSEPMAYMIWAGCGLRCCSSSCARRRAAS